MPRVRKGSKGGSRARSSVGPNFSAKQTFPQQIRCFGDVPIVLQKSGRSISGAMFLLARVDF